MKYKTKTVTKWLLYDCSRHNGPITLSLIASILYYTESITKKKDSYKKAHLKWNICQMTVVSFQLCDRSIPLYVLHFISITKQNSGFPFFLCVFENCAGTIFLPSY